MYINDPIDLTAEVIEVYPSFQVNKVEDQAKNSVLETEDKKVEKN